MRLAKTVIAAAIGLGVMAGSLAQADPMKDAIKYRKSAMTVTKYNFGMMADMVKGKIPFDKKKFAKMAETVHYMSTLVPDEFPKGSDALAGTTDAKDAVWSEPKKFQEHIAKFQKTSETLAKAAQTASGKSDIVAAFKDVGGSCKSCHDDFKEKN